MRGGEGRRKRRGASLPSPRPPSPALLADTLWAVVVAGSSGYGNYRHQADAAHAYHTLRAHGVPAGHVILMSADDAADSPYAPERYRGKLLNAPPPSPDVRAGAPVDYTGGDVTATTLLAVLLGDRGTVDRVAPNSTRRVLASGPADRLFLFFVDHGAPGLVG
jgi:legumain